MEGLRAWINRGALVFPERIIASNIARSSALHVIGYGGNTFLSMEWLRITSVRKYACYGISGPIAKIPLDIHDAMVVNFSSLLRYNIVGATAQPLRFQAIPNTSWN